MVCVRAYLNVAQKKEERSNDEGLQRGSHETCAIGHHIAPLTDQRPLHQKSVLSVSGAREVVSFADTTFTRLKGQEAVVLVERRGVLGGLGFACQRELAVIVSVGGVYTVVLGVVQVRLDLVKHLLVVGRLPVEIHEVAGLEPLEVGVVDAVLVLAAVARVPVLGPANRRR